MAFDKFDIIGALRTYCEDPLNNIKFSWQHDEFYSNVVLNQEYDPLQLILAVDLKPNPIVRGLSIGSVTYTGLFMVGRKFEAAGTTVASLDEDAMQKYDRRLLTLTSELIRIATAFSCMHELTLTTGQIDYLFNAFDSNIDFVVAQNIAFIQ